jgi:SAM-dependent methyltransferase
MIPFSGEGVECCVVDYTPDVMPGIVRLGSTLNEIPAEERFDAIVCSHVIEHVADPYRVVAKLLAHLVDGGVMYVEVPMEIWRKAPLHEEPVTHVNFFTARSLEILMVRAGLVDVNARTEGYAHPSGHRAVVVSAFGRHQNGRRERANMKGAGDATRDLLAPGIRTRVRRAILHPATIPATIARRARALIGGY